MKRIFLILSWMTLIVSSVSASTPVIDSLGAEVADRFTKFVLESETGQRDAEDMSKYIYVYTPNAPADLTVEDELKYIFEKPDGITPNGKALDDYLKLYNDQEGDNQYQHYVVVVNLAYAYQSTLNGINTSIAKDPAWYKNYSSSSQDELAPTDIFASDLRYYTNNRNLIYEQFIKNFSFDVFTPGKEKIMSFFTVWHKHSLAENEFVISGKKCDRKMYWSGNNSQETKDKIIAFQNASQPDPSRAPLDFIWKTCVDYVKDFYGAKITDPSTDCSDWANKLLYPRAREYFESFCNDPTNPDALTNANKKSVLLVTSNYVEYLDFVYTTKYDEDASAFPFTEMKDKLSTLVEGYYDYIDEGGNESLGLYIRSHYELLDLEISTKEDLSFYKFISMFYDENQPDADVIGKEIEAEIRSIDFYWHEWNTALSVYGIFTHPFNELFVEGDKVYNLNYVAVEKSWEKLRILFGKINNGAYGTEERLQILQDIKNIDRFEVVMYDKFLHGDGGGSLFIASHQEEAAKHLSDLIVKANKIIVENAKMMDEDDNETYDENILNGLKVISIPYSYNDNYAAGNRDIVNAVVPTPNEDKTKFDYKVNLCKKYGNPITSNTTINAVTSLFYSYKKYDAFTCVDDEDLDYNDVGFFDLVLLLDLEEAGVMANYCYENLTDDNFLSKPAAGFYISLVKENQAQDEGYKALTLTFEASFALITFGQATMYQGLARHMMGIFFVNDSYGLWLTADPVGHKEFFVSFYEDEAEGEAQYELYNTIHAILGVSQIGLEPTIVNKLLVKQISESLDAQKAAAIARAIDDMVDNVPAELLSENIAYLEMVRNIGNDATHKLLSRGGATPDELAGTYRGLVIFDHPLLYDANYNRTLLTFHLMMKTGPLKYRSVESLVQSLEQEGKLLSFLDALKDPDFFKYITYTGYDEVTKAAGEAAFLARVDAWKGLDNIKDHIGFANTIHVPTLEKFVFDLNLNPTLGSWFETLPALFDTWNRITKSTLRYNAAYLSDLRAYRLMPFDPTEGNVAFRHYIYGDLTLKFTAIDGDPLKTINLRFPAAHFLDPDPTKGGLVSYLDEIRDILQTTIEIDGVDQYLYNLPGGNSKTSLSGMHSETLYLEGVGSGQFSESGALVSSSSATIPKITTFIRPEFTLNNGQDILRIENLGVRSLNNVGWEKIRDGNVGDALPTLDYDADLKWFVKSKSTMFDPTMTISELEEIGMEAFHLRVSTSIPSKWKANIDYGDSTVECEGFIDIVSGLMKSSYFVK